MVEISEDVCHINDDDPEWETIRDYYKSISNWNDLLIDLNNPLKIFDIEQMISLFNYRLLDDFDCTFCKYKLEYLTTGVMVSLYGRSYKALSLFHEFCDFYNGANKNAWMKVKGTEIYKAKKPDCIKQNYSSYYEDDTIYKFVFDYYKCYDWLKHVLTDQIKESKENCKEYADEYGLFEDPY